MRILYDAEKKQTDVYRYAVNQGGDLKIKVSNGSDRHVEITFINGKLSEVSHNLGDFNLRSNWHVFGAISQKIVELEKTYIR